MAMYAPPSEGKEFERPETGSSQGVCVDIRYLGRKRGIFKGVAKLKPKVLLTFQIPQRVTEGKFADERMTVSSRFTWSLYGSAQLRTWLESWLGRKLADSECDSKHADYFDFETLLGRNAMLSLTEDSSNGRTYTNISSIMPWDTKFGALMEPENYIRVQNRDGYEGPIDDTLDGSHAQASDSSYYDDPESAATPDSGSHLAREEDRKALVRLAIKLWGTEAKAECANRYTPIAQMTQAVLDMATREVEQLIADKEAKANQPAPAPAQPALVPAGVESDPFDDFDDSDPFADQ